MLYFLVAVAASLLDPAAIILCCGAAYFTPKPWAAAIAGALIYVVLMVGITGDAGSHLLPRAVAGAILGLAGYALFAAGRRLGRTKA